MIMTEERICDVKRGQELDFNLLEVEIHPSFSAVFLTMLTPKGCSKLISAIEK